MKKTMKRGFEVHTIYNFRSNEQTYRLEVWEQPLQRWLIAWVYHQYDMRIFKMPGFKLLANLRDWHYRNRPEILPLSAEQDCKCYWLSEREKVLLGSVEVSKEFHDRVHGPGSLFD